MVKIHSRKHGKSSRRMRGGTSLSPSSVAEAFAGTITADIFPKPLDVEEWFEVDCAASDLNAINKSHFISPV